MKFVYSDRYEMDIGAHVFPTDKYRLVREQLLDLSLVLSQEFVEPPEPDMDDIALVHTREYLEDMRSLRWTSRTRSSELPLTNEIVQGFLLHASGTVLACRLALKDGIAMQIGGGFHHAFADHGEGFCYINDIAVGISRMLKDELIKRAAVIDCDLHQGNGTAHIFADDPRVFTFSIHQEHLYPIKQMSDWDIGLDAETGDSDYIERLSAAVPKILESQKPELVVFAAGADPYRYDQLGELRLTIRGLALRDRIVIEGCRKREIPVVPVLAGGYALDKQDTVNIHVNTARECLRAIGQLPTTSEPLLMPATTGEPGSETPEEQ